VKNRKKKRKKGEEQVENKKWEDALRREQGQKKELDEDLRNTIVLLVQTAV
jgi:hypothetical protein